MHQPGSADDAREARMVMDRTLVVFSGDEVIVAATGTASQGPGTMTLALGYERAVTRDGELMLAVVPRHDEGLVSSLGVPIRDVEPGAVLIESVAGDADEDEEASGRAYVVASTPEQVFVIAADAVGTFTETAQAPGGPVYMDSHGGLVYASFPYDTNEDWWSWLLQRGINVYPSLHPPVLYLQHQMPPIESGDHPVAADSEAAGRHRSSVRSWVSLYDGPARSAVITAIESPGRHWTGLDRCNDPGDDHTLWCNEAGEVVVVEMTLDDRGIPLSAPAGMNVDLLGSMTLWPRPDLRFLWWHHETDLFPADTRLSLQDVIGLERGGDDVEPVGDGGPAPRFVHGLAELIDALDVGDRRGLEEAVDEYIELDGRIDWDDVDEGTGLTVVVHDRGTTLEYPFTLGELWQTLDELEEEVTVDLDREFAVDPDDEAQATPGVGG